MWAAVCYRISYFHTILEIPKPRMIYKFLGSDYLLKKAYLGMNFFTLQDTLLPLSRRSTKKRDWKNKKWNLQSSTIVTQNYIELFSVVSKRDWKNKKWNLQPNTIVTQNYIKLFSVVSFLVQRHWRTTKKVMIPGCDKFQSTAIYIHILYGKGESLDKKETDSVTAAGNLGLRSEHMLKSWTWGFENLLSCHT